MAHDTLGYFYETKVYIIKNEILYLQENVKISYILEEEREFIVKYNSKEKILGRTDNIQDNQN